MSGMKMTWARRAVLLLFLVIGAPAWGGLTWESPTVSINTQGRMEKQAVEFRFRNASDHPVRIRRVKTSCGCTVATPGRGVYAPGEDGVLRVEHKPKPGTHRYRISVTTDEGGGRTQDLWLVVMGEQRLVVEGRRMLTWARGEARAPKEIIFRTKPGDPLQVMAASADSDLARVELAAPGADGAQTLRVTPKGGATGTMRIHLQTEPPLPEMEGTFYAIVR